MSTLLWISRSSGGSSSSSWLARSHFVPQPTQLRRRGLCLLSLCTLYGHFDFRPLVAPGASVSSSSNTLMMMMFTTILNCMSFSRSPDSMRILEALSLARSSKVLADKARSSTAECGLSAASLGSAARQFRCCNCGNVNWIHLYGGVFLLEN